MRRRGVLALVGVALGSGCSAIAGGPSYSNDAFTEVTTETGRSKQLISGRFELSEGEVTAQTVRPRQTVQIRIGFDADRPLDLILLDQADVETLVDGNEFFYYQSGSLLGQASGEVRTGLQSGNYAVVFDNSRIGETAPDGSLSGTFTIELSLP
jgi:hypothetical protein